MNKNLLGLIILLCVQFYQAQIPSMEWAKSFGGIIADWPLDLVVDSSGNAYSTGKVWGPADFDPGPDTLIPSSLFTSYTYVQKLNANGDFEWVTTIDDNDGNARGNSISIGPDGNLVICGYYSGTCDFDPDTTNHIMTSVGSRDIYVQKLDPDGNFLWAKSMGGIYNEIGYSVSCDLDGNIYYAGSYSSNIADFDPGIEIYNLVASDPNGDPNLVIGKLNTNGEFIWAKTMSGQGYAYPRSLTLDQNNNIYLSGMFGGLIDFDPSAGTYTLPTDSWDNIFIEKLDLDGDFIWARVIENLGDLDVSVIEIDDSGGVYTVGYYAGTIDFDPTSNTFELTASNNRDTFINKLNENGEFVWAKSIGGTFLESGSDIVIDSFNNLYITGYFDDGTSDFDPGPGTENLTSVGVFDVYIDKLDSDGNFLWAISLGSPISDYGDDIAIDPQNNIYVSGHFSDTCDFDPDVGVYNLYSNDNTDVFIMKLDQCSSIATISESDSNTLQANYSGAFYQWLDCENDYAPIANETDQTFTPNLNGTYAVEVTLTGCASSDTSACVNIEPIGIVEGPLFNNFILYPNPATKVINVSSEELIKEYSITNLLGELIIKDYPFEREFSIRIKENGVYILRLVTGNNSEAVKKIIISN